MSRAFMILFQILALSTLNACENPETKKDSVEQFVDSVKANRVGATRSSVWLCQHGKCLEGVQTPNPRSPEFRWRSDLSLHTSKLIPDFSKLSLQQAYDTLRHKSRHYLAQG
jgi:hypothetical protein